MSSAVLIPACLHYHEFRDSSGIPKCRKELKKPTKNINLLGCHLLSIPSFPQTCATLERALITTHRN